MLGRASVKGLVSGQHNTVGKRFALGMPLPQMAAAKHTPVAPVTSTTDFDCRSGIGLPSSSVTTGLSGARGFLPKPRRERGP